eukprot:1083222-Rhodomonas_salina.2
MLLPRALASYPTGWKRRHHGLATQRMQQQKDTRRMTTVNRRHILRFESYLTLTCLLCSPHTKSLGHPESRISPSDVPASYPTRSDADAPPAARTPAGRERTRRRARGGGLGCTQDGQGGAKKEEEGGEARGARCAGTRHVRQFFFFFLLSPATTPGRPTAGRVSSLTGT